MTFDKYMPCCGVTRDSSVHVPQEAVNKAYQVMDEAGVKGLDEVKRFVYPVEGGGENTRDVVITKVAILQIIEENAPVFMSVKPRKNATYIFLIDNLYLKNAMRMVVSTGAFDGNFMESFVHLLFLLIANGGSVSTAAIAMRDIVEARRVIAVRKTKLVYRFIIAFVIIAFIIARTAYHAPGYDPLIVDAARIFVVTWGVVFAIVYIHQFVVLF